MRVLIIGVNEFIGRSIALEASALGHTVFGMRRSAQAFLTPGVSYLVGDRSQPQQIQSTVQAQNIDVVVDVIPMVVANTQPLLKRLDGQIHQYIMLSSCDVYANYELLHRRATGQPRLDAVDDAPWSKPRELDPVTQLGWVQKFAAATGWEGSIELTDSPDDAFLARLSNLDLDVPFIVDGSRLRKTIDFSDVVAEPEVLARTIASEAV